MALAASDRSDIQIECAMCHEPFATASGVYNRPQLPRRQGVGCDYCHRVSQLAIDNTRVKISGLDADTGLSAVKYGPFDDARSPFHGTTRSDYMETPILCAACHEYVLANGVAIDASSR